MTAVFKAEDFRDTIIVLLSNNMNSGLGEVGLLLQGVAFVFDMGASCRF